jgi:uncharacterized protein (DUF2384 family)
MSEREKAVKALQVPIPIWDSRSPVDVMSYDWGTVFAERRMSNDHLQYMTVVA